MVAVNSLDAREEDEREPSGSEEEAETKAEEVTTPVPTRSVPVKTSPPLPSDSKLVVVVHPRLLEAIGVTVPVIVIVMVQMPELLAGEGIGKPEEGSTKGVDVQGADSEVEAD